MDEITLNKVALISNDNSYKKQGSSLEPQSPPKPTSVANSTGATGATGVALRTDVVQVQSTINLRNLDTVKIFEQKHARLNQLAKEVRVTNELINNVAEKIDGLQSSLQAVVKNFPPFSMDSQERQDILLGYLSLRKEILSLQVPTPPPPVYDKVGHMWDSLFDKAGQLQKSVVPDMNPDSSDSQLRQASVGLDKTSAQLADLSTTVTQALVNS